MNTKGKKNNKVKRHAQTSYTNPTEGTQVRF